tara:strand:+ start:649 stop:798 length:150 start_codon:yes stop_codon:yes gene_type:complete
MKGILKQIEIVKVLRMIFWCLLELDAKAGGVMPPERYYKQKKADKYYPF